MQLRMDAVHAARCAGHGLGSKKRNTTGAAKVGALAAATCMLLAATKISVMDRRPGLQIHKMLEAYDYTGCATFEPRMSAGVQTEKATAANTSPHRARNGGCTAAVPTPPLNGTEKMAQAMAPYKQKMDIEAAGDEKMKKMAGQAGEQPQLAAQPASNRAAAKELPQPAAGRSLLHRPTILEVAARLKEGGKPASKRFAP